jgi:hypothetical protein
MWPAVSNLDDDPNRAYLRQLQLLDVLAPPPKRRVNLLLTVLRKLVSVGKVARRKTASSPC